MVDNSKSMNMYYMIANQEFELVRFDSFIDLSEFYTFLIVLAKLVLHGKRLHGKS